LSVASPSQSVYLSPQSKIGWIRNTPFDLTLIVAVAVIALASGAVSLAEPQLFKWILLADIWLLGYHHVVSTYTRIAFDKKSFSDHRFLVIQLPMIVLVTTVALVLTLGFWVLPTIYLYWQWFHYTRQSYGIERIYRRKAGDGVLIHDRVVKWALYLLPLAGILYRSAQKQETFLGMEVVYLPVHTYVVVAVAMLALAALVYWMVYLIIAAWRGRLAVAHTLYLLSHHLIFLTGYILIDDITTGWLVLNVWHNAQYIMIVWLYNNNRFKEGIDKEHHFLSTISQTKNMLIYYGICIAISTSLYFVLHTADYKDAQGTIVPVTLVALMVINFHHYIVDGIIWKVRKKSLREKLGINN